MTGILELGLSCQLQTDGDEYRSISRYKVDECTTIYVCRVNTVVYLTVNHMFVSLYNESFIYKQAYSCCTVSVSEWAVS